MHPFQKQSQDFKVSRRSGGSAAGNVRLQTEPGSSRSSGTVHCLFALERNVRFTLLLREVEPSEARAGCDASGTVGLAAYTRLDYRTSSFSAYHAKLYRSMTDCE